MDKPYHENLWDHMGSIEFQAAFVIFDKYKRKIDLDLKQLVKSAQTISATRKEKGKTPNIDYLIQELGKSIKE